MESLPVTNTIYTEEVYSIPIPVVIVIGVPWSELADDQLQLLSKILQAVRLSIESVRVIFQPGFDSSAWQEKPSKVIAFVEPKKGINSYEVIQTGAMAIVFSDPLAQLIADEAGKRKLWSALKSLF